MMLSNGKIIKTDPLNKDTDGDGLSDGEEMGRYNAARGYYPCYSNPLDRDTDDDGYEDYRDLHPRKVARYSDIFGPVDSLEHLSNKAYKEKERKESDAIYGKGIYESRELARIQAKAAAIVVYLQGGIFYNESTTPIIMPNASKNLDHYLMGTGEDFNIDTQSIVFRTDVGLELYKKNNKMLQEHIEDVLKDGDKLIVGVKDDIIKGKQLVAFTKRGKVEMNNLDWIAAVGECNVNLTGEYSRNGNSYIGYCIYTVYDFYDWEKDSNATLSIFIPTDGEMYKLHHAGLAKQYYLSGKHYYNHSWMI